MLRRREFVAGAATLIVSFLVTDPARRLAAFLVGDTMSLTMSPTSGLPGATVTATGARFGKKLQGSITFGTTVVASFTTAGNGSFTKQFTVPSGYAGQITVTATTRAAKATAPFTALLPQEPPAPPPDPEPSVDCTGVTVPAGSTALEVQALINANVGATTFCWEAGEYTTDRYIIPKSGNTHRSVVPRGAILTGLGVYQGGFKGYGGDAGQKNVTIEGFVVEKMANPETAGFNSAIQPGWGWTVTNCEVRECAQVGVQINEGIVLEDCYIHRNGRYGYAGGPCATATIRNNEIAYNNLSNFAIANAGGTKIIRSGTPVLLSADPATFPLQITGNYVHHNKGHGIHLDWCNAGAYIADNTVEDNEGIGIFYEGSIRGLITNNICRRNNIRFAGTSIYNGAEIFFNDSWESEVSYNTVVAGVHGIGMRDGDRGSDTYGLAECRDNYIHHNTITHLATSRTGLVGPRANAYVTGVNRFEANTYHVPDASLARWIWSVEKTFAQWQALGHDDTGSLLVP